MVGGKAPAPEPVQEHGDPQRLGQRAQGHLAMPPVQARAGHDHGPLGAGEHRRDPFDQIRFGSLAAPGLKGDGRGRLRLDRLHEHLIQREIDEHRSGRRRHRSAERLVQKARDLGRGKRRRRQLHERPHERDVIDLLQRALAPAHLRRAATQDHQRRPVLGRRGDRAHPVGHPRTRGQGTHAGRARDLRPALRRERRRLLVAEVDQLDALAPAAVVDREQVAAGEGEELRDAVGAQAPCDEASAVEPGRGLGLSRHDNGR